MRVRPAPSGPPTPPQPSGPPHGAGRARSFTAVLGDRVVPVATPPPPQVPPPARSASAPRRKLPGPGASAGAAPVRALLERTLGSERQVDSLLAAAARGKTFSPSELLALQATVFRYSQAVEVVSRATDKLVGAVKQTRGTQV